MEEAQQLAAHHHHHPPPPPRSVRPAKNIPQPEVDTSLSPTEHTVPVLATPSHRRPVYSRLQWPFVSTMPFENVDDPAEKSHEEGGGKVGPHHDI